jgi:transketolase N-terminal domain/subunit
MVNWGWGMEEYIYIALVYILWVEYNLICNTEMKLKTQEPQRPERISTLEDWRITVRARTFETILEANNGHIWWVLIFTELIDNMYFGGYLNYDPDDSKNPNRRVLFLLEGMNRPTEIHNIFNDRIYRKRKVKSGYMKQYGTRTYMEYMKTCSETPGVDISPWWLSWDVVILRLLVLCFGNQRRSQKDNKIIVFFGDGEANRGKCIVKRLVVQLP